jgi:hypothetical protein
MIDRLSMPKLILLYAAPFAALGPSQASAQQQSEISAQALPPGLEKAIAESREALGKILQW